MITTGLNAIWIGKTENQKDNVATPSVQTEKKKSNAATLDTRKTGNTVNTVVNNVMIQTIKNPTLKSNLPGI